MDEVQSQDIWSLIAPKCPVKVGDRFYRDNYCVRTGACFKDYIRVVGVTYIPEEHIYHIRGKYENHGVGTSERVFSSKIFDSPDWVIVKRGDK